jgi:uncharacterized membrane protein
MPGLIGLVVGRGFGLLVITGLVIGRLIGFVVSISLPGLPGLIGIVVGRFTGFGVPGLLGVAPGRLTPCAGLDLMPPCGLPGFMVLILFVSFIPGMLLTLLG